LVRWTVEPPTARLAGRDGLVRHPGVGRQQDLGPLQLARGMPAAVEHGPELMALGLAQLDPVAYGHHGPSRQGQYLALIDAYTRVHGRPPAEADLQRHFRVSPPSVHQMVLTLERAGLMRAWLIRRKPGLARSIEVLVEPERLPVLRSRQPVKSSVQKD
jgi:hypothetical protein